MNALLIILIVSNTLAHYVPRPSSPNVGTVLFTLSDLNKTHWSRTNIALLQARQYMQKILPSPQLGSINDEYITDLLNYFEKSYKTVKREIKNPYLGNMVDVALSDTLGGYLKEWVLPIAKYSYYGGVLSLDNCLKVFETYEDIRRGLNTDGNGWQSPNKDLLNSVEINVLPPPIFSIRSMSLNSPCEQLAYYVKTDEGMKIPMPHINWDMSPPTMFLPLLNQSIVSLSSPSSSSSLLKYYVVADECTKSEIPNLGDFCNRFDKWLTDEVAPHLSDDKFYAAFGSILSLMHSTKEFCGKQIDNLKEHLLRHPVTFTSKRFLIIALILIVELLWCIPSVIYAMRFVRKKRKEKDGNKTPPHRQQKCIKSLCECNKQSKRGLKLFVEPKTANLEIGTQSGFRNLENINLFSKSVYSHYDLINLENERASKASSGANLPALDTTSTLTGNRNVKRKPEPRMVKTNVEKAQELKLSKTVTLVQSPKKYIKDITYLEKNNKLSDKNTLVVKCDNNIRNIREEYPNAAGIKFSQNEEKYRDIVNKPKTKRRKLKIEESDEKLSSKTVMFSQTDPIIEKQKGTMVKPNEIRVKNKDSCKPRSSDKPMLSILIEKPQTSIKLGIMSYKGPGTIERPSKIPRAVRLSKDPDNTITKTNEPLTKTNNLRIKNQNTQTRKRVLKGKTLDDSSIKQTSINQKDKKLNVTL